MDDVDDAGEAFRRPGGAADEQPVDVGRRISSSPFSGVTEPPWDDAGLRSRPSP